MPRCSLHWASSPVDMLCSSLDPRPENSILEVVRAYGAQRRGLPLVVLGKYEESSAYPARVLAAAGAEVMFPGAIYDREIVDALRFHSRFYVHGHTVGGTNPALVEAMGAGAATLAQDNGFNRWVAGDAATYFASEADCDLILGRLCSDDAESELAALREAARARHTNRFLVERNLEEYEAALTKLWPVEEFARFSLPPVPTVSYEVEHHEQA